MTLWRRSSRVKTSATAYWTPVLKVDWPIFHFLTQEMPHSWASCCILECYLMIVRIVYSFSMSHLYSFTHYKNCACLVKLKVAGFTLPILEKKCQYPDQYDSLEKVPKTPKESKTKSAAVTTRKSHSALVTMANKQRHNMRPLNRAGDVYVRGRRVRPTACGMLLLTLRSYAFGKHS